MQLQFSELPDKLFQDASTKHLFTDKCSLTLADSADMDAGLLDIKLSALIVPAKCTARIRIGKVTRKTKLRVSLSTSDIEVGDSIFGHWFIASWNDTTIRIGEQTTANNGSNFAVKILAEPGSRVDIGKDCMFSDGITLQCGGQHSIIALKTRERLSGGTSAIRIGDHCWLGRDVTLVASSKETTIGRGSIVATRAVVTKSIPPNCIVAGNPARTIKEDVTWSRQFAATQAEIDRVCEAFGNGPLL